MTEQAHLQDLVAQGREATSREDWMRADEIWSLARSERPNEAVAYVLGGFVKMQIGSMAEAENLLEYATRFFPDDTYAHIFYGDVAYLNGNAALAAERLIKIGRTPVEYAYKKAFDILTESIERTNLPDNINFVLMKFLFEQNVDIENSVPLFIKEFSWVQEMNTRLYEKLKTFIEINLQNFRREICDDNILDYVLVSCNIQDESIDQIRLATNILIKGGQEFCYEIFHRHAIIFLDATKAALIGLVHAGHLKSADDTRLLLLAQIASVVDNESYLSIFEEASSRNMAKPLAPTSLLASGYHRRVNRLSANINKGRLDRPLKIAVCVSGQLRGFEEAAKTWSHLGLDSHQATFFVSAWKKIGRKFPVPQHAMRTMSGILLDAYRSAYMQIGHEAMLANYPRMFALFEQGGEVTSSEVSDVYGTPFVYVEDDTRESFANMNNFQKMYYKIKNCQQMVDLDGRDFDLVVRIRPDKSVSAANVDYHNILFESIVNDVLYSDVGPYIHCRLGHIIGDQFAISNPAAMRVYASAYDQTMGARLDASSQFPSVFEPHVNLATSTLSGGLIVRCSHGIEFGNLMDVAPIPPSDILNALEADISTRTPTDLDELLISGASIEARGHKLN